MTQFDLAIAYKWIYDKELTEQIEILFHENNLSTYVIHKNNIEQVTYLLRNNQLSFKAFLDRGSDEDEDFEEIAQILSKSNTFIINDYKNIDKYTDKATMQKELQSTSIKTPKTIIIPPFDELKDIDHFNEEINKFDKPFIIKPSYYSGGSEGINLSAATIEDVKSSRMINTDDSYLIQEYVYPIENHTRRIWFRSYWFFNQAFPLWWDDKTHIYSDISNDEFLSFNINEVQEITRKIAAITGLEYFSTEVTINKSGEFIVIDYVNDQCDFRKQSSYVDGTLDWVVEKFITKMIEKVKRL